MRSNMLFDRFNIRTAVKGDHAENKIKILLMSFVRHIELQNFLIAPRRLAGLEPALH